MYHKKKINLIFNFIILLLPISFLIGSFFVNLIAILVSIYTLICIIKFKDLNFFFNKPNLLFFILFCIFLLSSFASDYKITSFENSFNFYANIILFISLTYFTLNDDEIIFKLSRLVFFIIILICIDLWIQKYNGSNVLGYTTQQAGRLTSFFKDEQIPGIIIFKFSPFVIYYLLIEKKNQLIVNYKYYILLFIYLSVLITGERAASILSTLLVISIIFFNLNLLDKKKLIRLLLLFSVILIVLLSQTNSIIKQRFFYTFIQTENNIYSKLYQKSFKIFQDNIILGTGPQSYRYECPKFTVNCSSHPHNFILELLSDSGLFSPIILLLGLAFVMLNKIKKINNKFHKSIIISYTILFFFPVIPTGSFFSSFHMTLTWFSLGFIYASKKFMIKKD